MPLPQWWSREVLALHGCAFGYRHAQRVLPFLACMWQVHTLWHSLAALTGSVAGWLVCR